MLAEKNSISAQPVSVRNWSVNKLTRQTRDVYAAKMARSNIFPWFVQRRKNLDLFSGQERVPNKGGREDIILNIYLLFIYEN